MGLKRNLNSNVTLFISRHMMLVASDRGVLRVSEVTTHDVLQSS